MSFTPNKTMLQAFGWYMKRNGALWNKLAEIAPDLKEAGINMVWLPPAYKGASGQASVGYDVYDRYDLGEFNQKNTIPTKYGTKDEYLRCIRELHKNGIKVLADIVLNQMCGGDETDTVMAASYEKGNRKKVIDPGPFPIDAYTHFTFSGRKEASGKPVEEWDYRDFNSVDYDHRSPGASDRIYLFDGKSFAEDVSHEYGNYDFLLGCNIDYQNEATREKTIEWGKWYMEETHADGFRLDAVKHIRHSFMQEWVLKMQEEYARKHSTKKLFIVGEYFPHNGEPDLIDYPEITGEEESFCSLFDFPLQDKLQKHAYSLFSGSLLADDPKHSVTLVNNHDMARFQPFSGFHIDQGDFWNLEKPYAWILFQEKGIPCIYLDDLIGFSSPCEEKDKDSGQPEKYESQPHDRLESLLRMCLIRKECAYGKQMTTEIDRKAIRGYVRIGLPSRELTGMVVLMTYDEGGEIQCRVTRRPNEKMVNIFSPDNGADAVQLDEEGYGTFRLCDKGLGVWITEKAYRELTARGRVFNEGFDWMTHNGWAVYNGLD